MNYINPDQERRDYTLKDKLVFSGIAGLQSSIAFYGIHSTLDAIFARDWHGTGCLGVAALGLTAVSSFYLRNAYDMWKNKRPTIFESLKESLDSLDSYEK